MNLERIFEEVLREGVDNWGEDRGYNPPSGYPDTLYGGGLGKYYPKQCGPNHPVCPGEWILVDKYGDGPVGCFATFSSREEALKWKKEFAHCYTGGM